MKIKKYFSRFGYPTFLVALMGLILILMLDLSLLSALAKDNNSISFYIENKLMVLKIKKEDHKFPNFVVINKKEEEKKFKFPVAMPQPPRELHVPILMYHHIAYYPQTANQLQRGLSVSPIDFEQQLSYLKQAGYQTILMADLFKALYYEQKLPKKPVILTFDDGYDNAYYNAFPILKKYNDKGSFYLISNLVGQSSRLTWNQVKMMSDNGMEFGSHSKSHPDLRSMPFDGLSFETFYSKKTIEDTLGEKVYFFCYPSGAYKPEIFAILKNQGYLLALTTHSGTIENSDHPFELPRLRIWGGISLDDFRNILP